MVPGGYHKLVGTLLSLDLTIVPLVFLINCAFCMILVALMKQLKPKTIFHIDYYKEGEASLAVQLVKNPPTVQET